jgi:hypothetical protein
MVVWQGYGFLVALIPLLLGIGAAFAADSIWGPGTIQTHGRLIYGTVALVSGGLIFMLARRLSRRPKRVLVDKETGQEVVLEESHTLWFVPLRFWAALLAVGGAVVIVIGLVAGSTPL